MSSPGMAFNPLAIAAPDLYAKQIGIARRQAIGQALLQGGSGETSGAFGGLKNAGNSIMGALLLRNADKDMASLYAPPDAPADTGQVSNSPPALARQPAQQQMTGEMDDEGNPVFAQAMPPQSQGGGQQPQLQQAGYSQPGYQPQQQPPRTIPEAMQRMVQQIPGMSYRDSLLAFMNNPTKYYEMLGAATAPTPEMRNYSAAYPGDPGAARQGLQGLLTHNSTLNFRPGAYGFDPGTGQGFGVPDNKGMAPVMLPNGQMGMQLAPGAGPALAGSAAATGFGQRTMTPATGYDSEGMPYGTNQASLYGLGGAQPPAAGPQQPGPRVPNIDRNNPLNVSPGGQVAQYQNPMAGFGAAWDNLTAYGNRGINTVRGVVSTWAPYQDQNGRVINPATPQNIIRIAQQLGVDPDQPLKMQDPNVKGALIGAMQPTETGQRYAPQQTAQAPQAGPLRPELPAGQVQFMQGQAKDAAERHAATVAAASESPMRINVLDNIINLSQQGVDTGPGQAWQNAVLGYASNTPFLGRSISGYRDNVAKFQELQKFMYQNALRNWQAAGGTGTDKQMESMAHANPNPDLFPQALQQIAKWGKAAELAVQGKANAQDRFLQQNGNTPGAQIKFESEWRNAYDPRAFQLQNLPPQEQVAFVKGLNPADARTILQKRQALRSMGALQ